MDTMTGKDMHSILMILGKECNQAERDERVIDNCSDVKEELGGNVEGSLVLMDIYHSLVLKDIS